MTKKNKWSAIQTHYGSLEGDQDQLPWDLTLTGKWLGWKDEKIYNYLMTLILFTLVIKCQPGKSDRGCGSGWYLWRLHNCPLQICSAFLFLLKIQDLSQIEKHRRWCQFQNKPQNNWRREHGPFQFVFTWFTDVRRLDWQKGFKKTAVYQKLEWYALVYPKDVSSHFYFLSHTATAGEAVKRAVILSHS